MPALLTVAQLREHIETDLVDAALIRLMDDAEAEMDARLGAIATQTETKNTQLLSNASSLLSDDLDSPDRLIFLGRRAGSITAVEERFDETDNVLVASDYKLLADGYRVERLIGGTNPSSHWRGVVKITYVPLDETIRRTRLEIDLVKLAVAYRGGDLETEVGDVRVESVENYEAERNRLFASLRNSGRRLLT